MNKIFKPIMNIPVIYINKENACYIWEAQTRKQKIIINS